MNTPIIADVPAAERLSGARIRAAADLLRAAAEVNSVVKLTPDAALAIADLIELLALHAGIELPEGKGESNDAG